METTKKLNLASYVEHTLLKPEATSFQIEKLCSEAIQFSFYGVCVNSSFISLAASKLNNQSVKIVSVVGFPLGACHSEIKSIEAQLAAEKGAHEIDMVINIGAAKEARWEFIEKEINGVVKSVNLPIKVILETGFLELNEIKKVCQISDAAGAHFVKTCTGFAPGSATVDHIQLMKASVSNRVGIKASGGIKTMEQAISLIEAGASRLGTSSGVQIINNERASTNTY